MINFENVQTFITNDNSIKIQYIIYFFIFMIALSNNLFENLFGCSIKKYTNMKFVRHIILVIFLYVIIEFSNNGKTYMNPILSFTFSFFIYSLFILLLNGNNIFIFFVFTLILLIIIVNNYKIYINNKLQDEELKQQQIDFINKSSNVFVILIILTILIGSSTSISKTTWSMLLSTKNTKIKC